MTSPSFHPLKDIQYLAKLLHLAYCQRDDAACAIEPGRVPSSANRPWDQLPEFVRESNRASAADFANKLDVVGRILVERGLQPEAPLSGEELEQLAHLEHDRWWEERARQGWIPGTTRDNERKVHPDMVPYEFLSDAIKQLDRDKVMDMITALSDLGYVLARRQVESATQSPNSPGPDNLPMA